MRSQRSLETELFASIKWATADGLSQESIVAAVENVLKFERTMLEIKKQFERSY